MGGWVVGGERPGSKHGDDSRASSPPRPNDGSHTTAHYTTPPPNHARAHTATEQQSQTRTFTNARTVVGVDERLHAQVPVRLCGARVVLQPVVRVDDAAVGGGYVVVAGRMVSLSSKQANSPHLHQSDPKPHAHGPVDLDALLGLLHAELPHQLPRLRQGVRLARRVKDRPQQRVAACFGVGCWG